MHITLTSIQTKTSAKVQNLLKFLYIYSNNDVNFINIIYIFKPYEQIFNIRSHIINIYFITISTLSKAFIDRQQPVYRYRPRSRRHLRARTCLPLIRQKRTVGLITCRVSIILFVEYRVGTAVNIIF